MSLNDSEPFPGGCVVVISGIMGAGKSTVAKLLAERLPRSVHVRGDLFRQMIVGGRIEMTPDAGPEALEQLRLRYEQAATVADAYARAGFAVVYQDIILGDDLAAVPRRIATRPLYVVVLAPTPDVVQARAERRTKVSGYGAWSVEALDDLLRRSPRMGLWLDSSAQTPVEAVDAIIERAATALVEERAVQDESA